MDNNNIQFVGAPCGHHGPYTFYKAFKYTKNGISRIMTLSEFFFVKLWMDSDLVCIGELQLLWLDKNSEQVLASLRLYFLPENTPEGRTDHGEDEVLAIAEKVVLRVEDLVTWITIDAEWSWGRSGKWTSEVSEPTDEQTSDISPTLLSESSLDFSDIEKEKQNRANCKEEDDGPAVVILSYPRYCRYRAMMRRLEGLEDKYLKYKLVKALGGFAVNFKNTRVMFCKDTFEYPELEGHEMLCNHLAPKLKGRPRGKRKKRSNSPGSESNESESSVSISFSLGKSKTNKNGIDYDNLISPRRSTRSTDNSEAKEFIKKLTAFMKSNRTPLGRTPCLGYKEVDLFEFYTKVEKLGGYDIVTSSRLWKSIFDDISGHQSSTGAATIIRRHYERFLLPYARHIRGEEHKPLPVSERRRLKSKAGSSHSESETSESTSGNTTPVPSVSSSITPSPSPSLSESKKSLSSRQECKTSSLRSVRVKTERQKDKIIKEIKIEDISCDAVEITKIEPKIEDIKSETIKQEDLLIKNEPSEKVVNIDKFKNLEPVTSAVALIAQVSPTHRTPSPVECQESMSLSSIKMEDSKKCNNEIIHIKDSPNHKSFESVEFGVPSDVETSLPETSKTVVPSEDAPVIEVKKGKLDILKEGGLEVTPVKIATSSVLFKETRPSVIQRTLSSSSDGSKSDLHVPLHGKMVPKNLQLNIPQSLNISKVITPMIPKTPIKMHSSSYVNKNITPPKVVQSKSIYSYSEKTVYGNPKDCLVNSFNPVHTPRAVNLNRPSGGDLLDLTLTSPQKPVVEIMRIPPNVPKNHQVLNELSSKNPTNSASLPMEGRKVGSNLEITLVGPSIKPSLTLPHNGKDLKRLSSNKRNMMENYGNQNKVPRIEENGKYGYREKHSVDMNIPRPFVNKPINVDHSSSEIPLQVQGNKDGGNFAYPHVLPNLYEANKPIPPYFPMIDPLLYSAAMQSLVSQNPLNPPPFMHYATPEQLKFYSELLVQNSRLPFSFPLPQDNEFSVTNNNNLKKL